MYMPETVSVSVIIPLYNRKDQIHEAIESVKSQTFSDWELIIVDDGSTDGTLESLEPYKSDERIIILSLPHNGHPGFVRNRAAEKASGKWLAFLDSDDLWKEDKLAKQMSYLSENEGFEFIHTLELWNRSGKTVSQAHRKHKKEGDLFSVSLGKCEIGPSTVLMTHRIFRDLGGFREDLEICEDYEFWLRVTSRQKVAYLDEALVIKRGGHEDQLSAKYGFIEIFKIEALKALVDSSYFSGENMIAARKELGRKCRIYSKGCRKRGREKEADRFESLYFYYSGDDGHKET